MKPLATILAVVVLCAGATAAQAQTNINLTAGSKLLDSESWGNNDQQGAFGLQTTLGPKEWPVQIAVDFVGSGTVADNPRLSTSGADIEYRGGEELFQTTFEFDLGVRKIWETGKARPYVGGGLAMIYGRQERNVEIDLESRAERLLGENGAALGELPRFPGGSIPLPGLVVSEDDTAPGVWLRRWRLLAPRQALQPRLRRSLLGRRSGALRARRRRRRPADGHRLRLRLVGARGIRWTRRSARIADAAVPARGGRRPGRLALHGEPGPSGRAGRWA